MLHKSYIDAFIPEEKKESGCKVCGTCLEKCPVMQMDKKSAVSEMKKLLAGETPERVLNECMFCFSCNSYCPEELKPYALIMERMVEHNKKQGKTIPPQADYMMTGKSDSGFFYDMYKNGTDEDKAILDKWEKVPDTTGDVLFIGCYGRSVPKGIEDSKTLSSLPKYAPRSACCGEIAHRFGDFDFFKQTVDKTYGQLSQLKASRLVCYCGSCANYLGNIWSNYHGVKLPFEVISLYEWLWEKYSAGEIEVKKKYEKEMVVSDSCYGSELGDGFFDALRGLYKAVGTTVVETQNNRDNTLCCGFATGIRNDYDHMKAAGEGANKFMQVMATGKKDVGTNCPGCWASMDGIRKAKEIDLNVHYAINFFLRSFGDKM